MDKRQAELLLAHADFLATKVERKKFDMAYIATGPLHKCGSVACVLGWMPANPALKSLRLKLVYIYRGSTLMTVARGENTDFRSVAAKSFGLDTEEVCYLFEPRDDEATPKLAARRIRRFVKKKLAEMAK